MLLRNPVQIWSELLTRASRGRTERPFSIVAVAVASPIGTPIQPQRILSTPQEFPSLDLLRSWSGEHPTISQIMAESSFRDSATTGDQSGNRPELWRSPNEGI